MRLRHFFAFAATVALTALGNQSAEARRTAIDASLAFTLASYCSPVEATSVGCTPLALPFSVTIGGTTYNSAYINSNGTLSFNSIAAQLAAQNSFSGPLPNNSNYTGPAPADSLGDYPSPIFSPNFVDGPGFPVTEFTTAGFDGAFASTFSVTPNSLTVNWFACTSTLACGAKTLDVIASYSYQPGDGGLTDLIISKSTLPCPCTPQAAFLSGQANLLALLDNSLDIFSLTLTDLDDGFMVDYRYNAAALGDTGLSGFNIPGGLNETTGPLANRSFRFDSNGQLVTAAVPEPSTWAMMLLGFLAVGTSIRRRSRKHAAMQSHSGSFTWISK